MRVQKVKGTINLFEIKFDGGGQVPEVLKGLYNKALIAERAIKDYLSERDGTTNGKKGANRRGSVEQGVDNEPQQA